MSSQNQTKKLSGEALDEVVKAVQQRADDDDGEEAWRLARPLVDACEADDGAAYGLAWLLRKGAFDRDHGLEAARLLFGSHGGDSWIIGVLGQATEKLVNIDYLNDAPAEEPFFEQLAVHLKELVNVERDPDAKLCALYGLGTAAKLRGRAWDSVAEEAKLKIIELSPRKWGPHYDLGLFYKTRGRFKEGQAANQRAWELGGAEDDSVRWNLGICATGNRDAEVAVRIWKLFGHKIEVGRFGLPEGRYETVKVRLAERPLAERGPQNDSPGSEESIWIERLSPCHGTIRSALYYDEIGLDYGDVVLIDGAPITHQTYGDRSVPVFPHLATLVRSHYSVFRFVGTQKEANQISKLAYRLPAESVLYSLTEQMRLLCRACFEGQGAHEHGASAEHRIINGKICAPPTVSPKDLLHALDIAAAEVPDVRVYVPELCEAAGLRDRAEFARRRASMIESA